MRLSTHRIPGLVLTGHELSVPLDHERPDGERLALFVREVVSPGREHDELPWLVFFQGGPGAAAPRPDGALSWIRRAVEEYRVLLLDQRGTGLSTPATFQTLARLATAQEQADYLKLFRADSIVRDAEWIRRELIGDEPWSALGQSFGGFCTTTYLSLAPSGLREAIITGGLPPIHQSIDDVYRATYRRVLGKNRRYYERYPDDVGRVRELAGFLAANDVRLPDGERLTPRRLQQLGMPFGASDGFEKVHYLLERAFVEGATGREVGYGFLRGVESAFSFEAGPVYALLHEAEYVEGAASRWSAERIRAEYPELELGGDGPVHFTGEMIYRWMFDEYRYLRPLKDAAELLAEYDGWGALYDVDVLQANTVPVAAAVYHDDMYVERVFSEETAQTIRGCRIWVTSEYEHNALRSDGARLLDRLLGMLHGKA